MDIQCPKALKSEQKRELDFGFKSAIDDTTRGLCSARLVSKSLVLLKKPGAAFSTFIAFYSRSA